MNTRAILLYPEEAAGTNSPACNVASPAGVTGKPAPIQAVGAIRLHPFLNAGPGYLFHGVEITAADIEIEWHIVESGLHMLEAEGRYRLHGSEYDQQEAKAWAGERQRGMESRRPEVIQALERELQNRLEHGLCFIAEETE